MQNNKNKFIFNNKNLQNIKRKIEEKTGVQLNQNNENEAFKPVRILRKPVFSKGSWRTTESLNSAQDLTNCSKISLSF